MTESGLRRIRMASGARLCRVLPPSLAAGETMSAGVAFPEIRVAAGLTNRKAKAAGSGTLWRPASSGSPIPIAFLIHCAPDRLGR